MYQHLIPLGLVSVGPGSEPKSIGLSALIPCGRIDITFSRTLTITHRLMDWKVDS